MTFRDRAQLHGERVFFSGRETVTYAAFAEMIGRHAAGITGGDSCVVRLDDGADGWARLLAAADSKAHILAGVELSDEEVKQAAAKVSDAFQPLLFLATGGTSGQPRLAVHAQPAFLQSYRDGNKARAPLRVLSLYAPGHLAGIDAFLKAFIAGDTLIVPVSREPAVVAATIQRHAVEVLPATPSYLQFLLLGTADLDPAVFVSVRWIPHGAEPMPAALRKRLTDLMPAAQLLQRFGLTELGALPVRSDAADADVLHLDEAGYAWKIADGTLRIRAPSAFLGYFPDVSAHPVEWHDTGDLAEATGSGGFKILGRRSSMINVGGVKVLAEQVEALMREDPQVLYARVYPAAHPLTGQCVHADVVFAATDADCGALRRRLRALLASRDLPLAWLPLKLKAVATPALTDALKATRS